MRFGQGPEGSGPQGDRDDRVPRLAAGIDAMSLALSPDEGFLLSRIDGHTPMHVLHQMGLPAETVQEFLGQWIEEGWVCFAGEESDASEEQSRGEGADAGSTTGSEEAAPPPPPVAETAPVADALPEIDEALDLTVEVQERVRELAGRLDEPYHQILGVDIDADARAVKKSYFALSKVFHPDRYFRRNLGPYEALIDRCFKRILEAYELLSDPIARKEVQREAKEAARSQADAKASESAQTLRKDPARMRRRLDQLSGQGRLRGERKRKAKTFFESGMAAFAKEKWLEAAGGVRLAIAFDPKNEVFRERFAEVQRKAHEELSKVAVARAEAALSLGDYGEAMTHFTDAVNYRPADAELQIRAARVAWQGVGELRAAKEMAMSACELEPENGGYHRTLGQIYAAAGLDSNARRELKRALELDPGDGEARIALKRV
ncbi:MAG: DnaJ domain-containing protein [Myxococcota bacterium]|nr:DnaJ domain-containing protein [Myxococcota bacterium]